MDVMGKKWGYGGGLQEKERGRRPSRGEGNRGCNRG